MKTKAKQLVGFVMAVCMCLSVLTLPVSAAGNVAKIGEVEYATLQEAVNQASDRTTITLLTNCADQNVVFPDDKAIIIDRTDSHFTTGKVGENLDATMKVYDALDGNSKTDAEKTEIYGGFDPVLDYINAVPRSNFISDLYKSVTMTKDQIMPNNVGGSTSSSITIMNNLTLDLNGYSLTQAKGVGWNNYPLIKVNHRDNPDPVVFTIEDSSEAKTGMLNGIVTTIYIAGGEGNATAIQNGGTICCDADSSDYDKDQGHNYRMPVRVEEAGLYEMRGGAITSNLTDESLRFVYVSGDNNADVRPRFIVKGGTLQDDGSTDAPEKVFDNCGFFVNREADFIVEPASGLKFDAAGQLYADDTAHFDIKSGLFADNMEGTIATGYGQDASNNAVYNVDAATATEYPNIVMPQYTVTVQNPDGSETTKSVFWGNVVEDAAPTPPSETATFVGYRDAAGNIVDLNTATIEQNYDLTAVWTANVTYQWSDAPAEAVLPTVGEVELPYELTVSDTYTSGQQFATDDGYYIFSGWYLDEALTNKAPATMTVNGNVNLYGSWTYHSTAKVRYHWTNAPTEAILPNPNLKDIPYEHTVSDAYTFGRQFVTDDGYYTFSGWYLNESMTDKAPAYIDVNGHVDLYGTWTYHSTVDKRALEQLIDQANNLHPENYTTDSYSELDGVLENAQYEYDNPGATQSEVDYATALLNDVIKHLVKRGDTATLNNYVTNDAVSVDDEDLYEADNWNDYVAALNVANGYIADNSNVSQEQVDTALANLMAAKDALVRIPIDFTELDAKITAANNADKTNKTDASIANLANAIAVAQAIKNSDNVTQAEVDAQTATLQAAIEALAEKPVDKRALEAKLQEAENAVKTDKTTDSVNALNTAKTAAETVNGNADATQDEVDRAVTSLEDAINGLVKCGDTATLNNYVTNDAVSVDDEDLYEADNWNDYVAALNVANGYIADNSNVSQEQVDTALANLMAAKDALVKKAIDFTALDEKITEANNADKTNKTDESVANLANAIAAAQAIKGVENVTQAEVDRAVTSLEEAIRGLQEKPVDKSALDNKLQEAINADKANKTEASIEALNNAITAAQSVKNNANATQADVDGAITSLEEAINGLEEKPVDKSALEAKITAANNADKTNKTAESIANLANAIAAAQAVMDVENATQADVDAQVEALDNAIEALADKPVDKDALHAKLNEATDADRTNKTEESVKALDDAIVAAQGVADDENATQADVDAQVAALEEAIKGLAEIPVDKSELTAILDEAKKVDTDGKTADSVLALTNAIAAGEFANGIEGITQDVVDSAVASIRNAMNGLNDEVVDKTLLAKAIRRGEIYVLDNLIPEHKKALGTALNNARYVYAKEDTNQAEVDDVTAKLRKVLEDIRSNKTYGDVKKSDWFEDVVDEAYARGLMLGTDGKNKVFSPYTNISRGMVATVLYRMAGSPAVTYVAKFPDVKANIWYTNAIIWASNNKVVNGYDDGKFGPDDNITREDLAIMLRNYAEKIGGMDTKQSVDLTVFEDCDQVDGYAKSAVEWAVANKIMSGKENGKKIAARDNANRSECAKMFTALQDILIP